MKPQLKRLGLGLAAAVLLGALVAGSLLNRRTLYTTTWFDLFDTVSVVKGYARSQEEWDAQMEEMCIRDRVKPVPPCNGRPPLL